MRVAMYYHNHDVRLEEVPTPQIGPGELLLKVMACGICGGDVMEWYRASNAPLVLGHEISGEVMEVGDGVARYRLGDRVSASHHVPCNTCYYCRNGNHTVCDTLRTTNFDPGGFAEYLRLTSIHVDRGVYPLPAEMSWEEATFIEPLACAVRGQRIAGIRPGRSVLIIGSGIAGLLHLKLARAQKAGKIAAVDVIRERIDAARNFGADLAIHAREYTPDQFRQLNEGRLADLVIACTGAQPAISQAFQSVERGGTVLLYAPTGPGISVPISVNDLFFRNDVTITTTYAASPEDHLLAREIIRTGRVTVQDMITHRLGLAEIGRGFALVSEGRKSLKVIIEPQR